MKKNQKVDPQPKKAESAALTDGRWWQKKFFFEGLVFVFAFLLFVNAIPNGYNMDDELVTIQHRLTSKGMSAIPEIFESPYYQDASGYSYEYRPIVLVSFAIEYQFFGDSPQVSHFWNVFFYALSCVLLYRTLRCLFKSYSLYLPLAITLLFAAHPAHTEVVCSIKNRDEILGLIFGLLTLLWTLKALRLKKAWMYILVPLFFSFALLSKLTFVSFALIVLLAVYLFETFSFWELLFVVVSMVVPFILIADFGDWFTKVESLLAAVILAIVVFALKYPTFCISKAKQLKEVLLTKDRYLLSENEQEEVLFSNFFNNAIPPFSTFSAGFVLFVSLLVGVFVVAVIYQVFTVQIATSFLLLFFCFNQDQNKRWIATLATVLIIIFRLYYYKIYFYNPYVLDVFALVVVYHFFIGKRLFLIPYFFGLLALIILPVVDHKISIGYIPFVFSLFINLFFQRFKYGWIVNALSFFIGVSTILSDTSSPLGDMSLGILFNLFLSGLMLSIYLKKRHWNLIKVYFVVTLLLSLFVQKQKPDDAIFLQKTAKVVQSTNVIMASQKQNRPIDYVENCIDYVKTSTTIKAGTSFEILSHYLYKVVLPYPLAYYYGYSFIQPVSITDTIAIISIIIHLLLIVVGLFCIRRNQLIAFGIFTYLASIAIFSNYFHPVPGMIGDRFLLVPSLGWIIVLVAIIYQLFSVKFTEKELLFVQITTPPKFIFLAVLCLYALLTFSRNSDWKDYLTLFRHDIKYVSNSAQANNLLALRLMKNSYDETNPQTQLSMRQEALVHFKKTLSIYPQFFNATFDVGRVYTILGMPDSALPYYQKAGILSPTFTDSYVAAGDILFQQQRLDEARACFQHLIDVYPENYMGYEKVSYIFFVQKRYADAIAVNKAAMLKIPSEPQACVGAARAFYASGMYDSTRVYLNKALAIYPAHPEATALLQSLGNK